MLTAVLLVLSLTVTAFAEGEDPPSVVEEEAPPVEEEAPPVEEEAPPVEEEAPPIEEEGLPVEEEEQELDMLMMSSSSTGPTDEDPDELGLPDPGVNGFYGDECEKPGNTCEKNEDAGEVKDGGTFTPTVTPNVVVIKAGNEEFIFSPSGPDCNMVVGGDPYCVKFDGDSVVVEVNTCYELVGKDGNCKSAKEISNIQFWLTGETPPPPPPPPPPPNGDDDDDDDDPGLVIRVDVATGGTSPAVFLWLATAMSGLAIPFVGKKKE